MARPFTVIGFVMLFTIFMLTCVPVELLPFICIISAIPAVILGIAGCKIKCLKPFFLVFLGIVLASCAYTVKMHADVLSAAELATEKEAIISGYVIGADTGYKSTSATVELFQLDNTETKPHLMKLTIGKKYNLKADDLIICRVDSITAYDSVTPLSPPDSDGAYLSAEADELLFHKAAKARSIRGILSEIRSFIRETVSGNVKEPYSGAIIAMLTGDRNTLDDDTSRIFSYSGIAHLFAVSGFHLSLWTAMIFTFTEHLRGRMRLFGNLGALLFVIFFMALTGFTPSVMRAGAMMLIFILSKIINQQADSLNSLCLALTVLLLTNPFLASSISLQLSFFATLGIISFASPLNELSMRLKRKIKPKIIFNAVNLIFTTSALSFVATVFTSPLCAVYFGYYSFTAPLTNILCLPVAQLVLPVSSLGLITSFIPAVSDLSFTICELIMKYVLSVAEKICIFRYCIVDTQLKEKIAVLLVILTVSVVLVLIFTDNKRALRRIAAGLTAVFITVSVSFLMLEAEYVTIHVPSVGNGTAVVCSIKGNRMVIGCGGDASMDYKFVSAVKSVTFKDFELLLIPRTTKTESAYAYDLLKENSFGTIIASDSIFNKETESILKDDAVRTSFANINIDESVNLVYIDNDNFHGARIETEGFTATVLFNPLSDFSAVDDSWREGNLLITRQKLPDAELSFEQIIVSTDKSENYNNSDIYSTAVNGNISYISTPLTGARLYADK